MMFELASIMFLGFISGHFNLFIFKITRAGEGWIFSFYGEFIEKWALDLETVGKSSFWLKPIGLCGYCFTTWLSILWAFVCSYMLDFPLWLTLPALIGLNGHLFDKEYE